MDGKGDAEAGRNVIRLPAEWVGPPEELVPIGPRARARERERLQREATETGTGSDATAAADFWSEGASAVHHAVQAPALDPPRRRRLRLPRVSVGVHRRYAAAAVMVVIALVVVAALGLGESPRHLSAVSHTAAVDSPGLNAVALAAQHPAATASRSIVRHTPVVRHRTDRRPAQRRGAHRTLHRSRPSSHTTVVSTGTATVVSSQLTPTTPVTPPTSEEPITTSGAGNGGSSDRSSSAPAGPAGPGSASGCNPKCS